MSFSFPLSSLPLSPERSRMEALLKPGLRFNARVSGVLADGRIRLSFSGQSLLLRPEKPLMQGSFVELRVHGGSRGILLEIVPEETKSSEGSKLQSPDTLRENFPVSFRGRMGQMIRSASRLQHLFSSPDLLRNTGAAEDGKPGAGLPVLSLEKAAEDNLPLLRGVVRAFLQEPPQKEAFGKALKEEVFHPSLAALAEKEGGGEGVEILQEFRESLAKAIVDQGRFFLPLPFVMDGRLGFGHFFMDLGESGRERAKHRILRAGILLELESLGRIRVEALLLGRELQLGFAAGNEAVLALFEEGVPELSERLESLGFRVLPVRYQELEEGAWERETVNGEGTDWEIVV